MVEIDKWALRQSMRQIRKSLSLADQEQASKKVTHSILNLKPYQQAQRLAFYRAFEGEIQLDAVWFEAEKNGKDCYFPVLTQKDELAFLKANQKTIFTPNRYGILEPLVEEDSVFTKKLDIIFIPLVAFDDRCTRLGMGKGYYDKTLADSEALLMGVAYEFQRQHHIEASSWDVPLHGVITQKTIYWR